jgi:hypothetical protein
VVPFERRVVACLTRTSDPALRAAVATYVEECLAAMPEHLRAGVLAESVALGAWDRVASRGRRDDAALRRRLAAWEEHPVDVVRQYVRLIGSLVLFAEVELGDRAAA